MVPIISGVWGGGRTDIIEDTGPILYYLFDFKINNVSSLHICVNKIIYF